MKASELMIGDILRYKQDFPFASLQGKIAKVCGVDGRVDVKTIDDDKFHESEHPNWLEPIPLTPEILKKNGFKDGQYFSELYIQGWHVISDAHNLCMECERGWHMNIPCRCVHELQHAFNLVGINKDFVV